MTWNQANYEASDGSKQPLITQNVEHIDGESGEKSFNDMYFIDLCGRVKRRVGLLWIAIGIFLQSAQIIFISRVSNNLGAGETLFFRSLFLMIPMMFVSWNKKQSNGPIDLFLVILCGLSDSAYYVLVAYASAHIWIGDVTTFVFNLPIPASIVACFFLHEPIDLLDGLIALLNAAGLILVAQPSFLFPAVDDVTNDLTSSQQTTGILLSLCALTGTLTSSLSCRALAYRNSEDVYLLTTFTGMSGLCLSLCTAALIPSPWLFPDSHHEWLEVIAMGVVALAALSSYIKSLEKENVFLVTVLFTLTIPLTYIYDFIVLWRPMEWITISGVALILGSSFCLYVKSVCYQKEQ